MMRHAVLAAVVAAGVLFAGCSGGEKPPAPQRQLFERSARLAFDRGEYARAAVLYEEALREALAEDDAIATVDVRFNLALVHSYLGEHAQALAQAELAEAQRARRGMPVDRELELLLATLHYRAGDAARALAALAPVLDDARTQPATRAGAHFLAGLVAADSGNVSSLRAHIAALAITPEAARPGDAVELEGRLLAIEGDSDGALRTLEAAAAARRAGQDRSGMLRVLVTAAGIAERAGDARAAARLYLRAGRSAGARGLPSAREWLGRARDLAVRSGDDALAKEAMAALESL